MFGDVRGAAEDLLEDLKELFKTISFDVHVKMIERCSSVLSLTDCNQAHRDRNELLANTI